ncbi:hypothetical protein FKP32DRAFT_1677765 [Trametes sanguinea]|nr:hypothetical protein FKP32DRAFT_1677765 [Trametes sanguinea]
MATSTIHAASNSGQGQDGQVAPVDNTSIIASTDVAAQDETPAANGQEWQPDGEFWFEDGNLILIARRVEFRVYKGPLVANSPVFNDLLSLPQTATNPSGQSPASKCTCGSTTALLHVEDSPEDLRHLLRALMPGKTPRVGPHANSFHAISACIRLGRKYGIVCVVDRSLEYLKSHFLYHFNGRDRIHFTSPPAFEDIHSIGVVNLARMTETTVLLPPALMACCRLSATELMNGFAREDGTREVLSDEDIGRCYMGRAALTEATVLFMLQLYDQTRSSRCKRPSDCKPVFIRLLNNVKHYEGMDDIKDHRWYHYFDDYFEEEDVNRRLCWPCFDKLCKRQRQIHNDTWQTLPELLGLSIDGWAEESSKEPGET